MTDWQTHLKDQLQRQEGWMPHAYQCPEGWWTIGYGRLIDKRRGGRITLMEGEMLLDNDINEVVGGLRQRLPWFEQLPERQKQALANMAFQMGVAGVMQFKRTLNAVELGNYALAEKYALESKWARQTPTRALEVAQMLGSQNA